MAVCKHCKIEFDIQFKPKGWMANHSRWCDHNPKIILYKSNLEKVRSSITVDSIEKRAKSISKAHASGKYLHVNHATFKGKKHSDATKRLMSDKALASKHRRLRRGLVEYNGIMLDSSWELALAKRLDNQNIQWVRPEPLLWLDDDGKAHNYFPDFYLPEYDLYLDPKNPYAIKNQQKKLKILLTQYSNINIICSLEECENYSIG